MHCLKSFACSFCTLACVVFLADCQADEKIRIGVWNIENLSTSVKRGFPELTGAAMHPPRTNAELDKIAAYINDELQVDALMVSEIHADSPLSTEDRPQSAQLNYIAEKLGDNWKYFLGKTGGKQRLGFLFDTDRVRLKKLINLHAPPFHVSGSDVLDRDPFIAWVSFVDTGGQLKNDVLLIGIHLKSIQKQFRHNRMAAVAKILGDLTDTRTRAALQLPSQAEEREIIILGDCNDSEFTNPQFKFIFDYLAGTDFVHLQPSSGGYPLTRISGAKIDHIFANSRVITGAMLPDSFRVHTVPTNQRAAYRKTFSDHFPVTVDLQVTEDTDMAIEEAMLVADGARRSSLVMEIAEEIGQLAEVAEPTEFDDEEEVGPPVVDYDIIDRDFDRILAPQKPGGETESAIAEAAAVEAPEPQARATGLAVDANAEEAVIWNAIEFIQESAAAILNRQDSLSAEDAKRVQALLQAERELLRAIRRSAPE